MDTAWPLKWLERFDIAFSRLQVPCRLSNVVWSSVPKTCALNSCLVLVSCINTTGKGGVAVVSWVYQFHLQSLSSVHGRQFPRDKGRGAGVRRGCPDGYNLKLSWVFDRSIYLGHGQGFAFINSVQSESIHFTDAE